MIDKIINKYKERLITLKENQKNRKDDYPYDLDIMTTKEILRDLNKIKDSLDKEV